MHRFARFFALCSLGISRARRTSAEGVSALITDSTLEFLNKSTLTDEMATQTSSNSAMFPTTMNRIHVKGVKTKLAGCKMFSCSLEDVLKDATESDRIIVVSDGKIHKNPKVEFLVGEALSKGFWDLGLKMFFVAQDPYRVNARYGGYPPDLAVFDVDGASLLHAANHATFPSRRPSLPTDGDYVAMFVYEHTIHLVRRQHAGYAAAARQWNGLLRSWVYSAAYPVNTHSLFTYKGLSDKDRVKGLMPVEPSDSAAKKPPPVLPDRPETCSPMVEDSELEPSVDKFRKLYGQANLSSFDGLLARVHGVSCLPADGTLKLFTEGKLKDQSYYTISKWIRYFWREQEGGHADLLGNPTVRLHDRYGNQWVTESRSTLWRFMENEKTPLMISVVDCGYQNGQQKRNIELEPYELRYAETLFTWDEFLHMERFAMRNTGRFTWMPGAIRSIQRLVLNEAMNVDQFGGSICA